MKWAFCLAPGPKYDGVILLSMGPTEELQRMARVNDTWALLVSVVTFEVPAQS